MHPQTYFLLWLSEHGPERAENLVLKVRPGARVVPAHHESREAFLQREATEQFGEHRFFLEGDNRLR